MFQRFEGTVSKDTVSSSVDSGECACSSPMNDNNASDSLLKNMFQKCAMCTGSGAGGFLIGHAGCLATPFITAAAGATVANAGLLGMSVAVTSLSLYAWHKLRGNDAEKWEKRLVVGGALTGVLLSSALHMGNNHQNHKDFVPTSWCGKSPPPTIIHQP